MPMQVMKNTICDSSPNLTEPLRFADSMSIVENGRYIYWLYFGVYRSDASKKLSEQCFPERTAWNLTSTFNVASTAVVRKGDPVSLTDAKVRIPT